MSEGSIRFIKLMRRELDTIEQRLYKMDVYFSAYFLGTLEFTGTIERTEATLSYHPEKENCYLYRRWGMWPSPNHMFSANLNYKIGKNFRLLRVWKNSQIFPGMDCSSISLKNLATNKSSFLLRVETGWKWIIFE